MASNFPETTREVRRLRRLMTEPIEFTAWEIIWTAFWTATFAILFWKGVGFAVHAIFRAFQ